ncbi:AglZ/HisF2 family acetamidino modification protein [Pseudoalteromonas sp. S3173]|uniref:AglZ/HisF2 family acetamidino modification protein n=1 Tax=Pseudoalteromonas sp. S3173 TaxID=579531 RepID=UPI00110D0622|nr:AglZ/HisF2 family acetamidino modification protein [Pseudoalteromonas sp. S3173]TMS60472.1 imidazole glycerol phosphate synthase subunit HisF [Pseudoalteromonas sp. S3173]
MLRTRVMPCLLLKGRGLVKTVKFKNERYVGDPINAVRIFNQKEVDELVLFDINCTTNENLINYSLLEQITSECFMPVCYGGGVRSLEDFRRLFSMGIEKVSVSSLLFDNPDIVRQAVGIYGSQSIIATLDINLTKYRKKYQICTHSGKKKRKYTPIEAAKYACSLGVGEIIINTIHRDGTWSGFDQELISQICKSVNVPVVAAGGAGTLDDIKNIVVNANASAVALGSMAVFQAKDMGVLIKFPKQTELTKILP